jgi:hypothetical protein
MEVINMNTMSKNKVVNLNKTVAVLVVITIGFTMMPGFVPKVQCPALSPRSIAMMEQLF